MSKITSSMLSLLDEQEMPDAKIVVPQLVLAMDALGMDPGDEGQQEVFIGMLKKLVTNKSALLKGMRTYNAAKAAKALKVARTAV